MQILQNLKIAPKILAVLGLLGALCLGLTLYSSHNLRAVDSDYSTLVDKRLPSTTLLARIHRLGTDMVYAGYRSIAYDGATFEAKQTVADEAAAYRTAKELLAQLPELRPDMADQLREFDRQIDEVHSTAGQAIKLGLRNENDAATATLAAADKIMKEVGTALKNSNEQEVAKASALSTQLSSDVESTASSSLYLGLAGIAFAMGLAVLIVRAGITRPLTKLQATMLQLAEGNNSVKVEGADRRDEIGSMASTVLVFRDAAVAQEEAAREKARADAEQKMVVETINRALDRVAAGDLTSTIVTDFPPEYAAVKSNFNAALDALRDLIGSVVESTSAIRTGSTEIAQASEDLARRTESNAASLEETAASVSQMDDRLRATAQAASRTVERADATLATVSGGRAVAEDAVQAMGRVSESAKGIDSVIEGLDKIAFQTRVLAMNAAVEAGRAGDAGRGFAVVADLVSALAMRAEEEAKRARDQLTVTQTDIVTAVESVQKVDGALTAISGDVSQVHQLLGQMAADNQAQSSAITQISSAIGTMDQSTQQNAAMVEETSAAARNLTTEVAALSEQAGRFKTGAAQARTRAQSFTAASATASESKPRSYVSPVKPLPTPAKAPALAGADDWNDF